MKNTPHPPTSSAEDKAFLLLLVVVTLAFGWVLAPFYGAVFWGAVLAILFAPLQARLARALPQQRSGAALISLLVILLLVLLPLAVIAAMLVQEAATVVERIQSGEFSISRILQQVYDALPAWITGLLNRFGLGTSGLL